MSNGLVHVPQNSHNGGVCGVLAMCTSVHRVAAASRFLPSRNAEISQFRVYLCNPTTAPVYGHEDSQWALGDMIRVNDSFKVVT